MTDKPTEIWTPKKEIDPNIKRIAMQLWMEGAKRIIQKGEGWDTEEEMTGDYVTLYHTALKIATAVWEAQPE